MVTVNAGPVGATRPSRRPGSRPWLRGSARAISRAHAGRLSATPTDVGPLFGLLKYPHEPCWATFADARNVTGGQGR
jgi:hypothetical protein